MNCATFFARALLRLVEALEVLRDIGRRLTCKVMASLPTIRPDKPRIHHPPEIDPQSPVGWRSDHRGCHPPPPISIWPGPGTIHRSRINAWTPALWSRRRRRDPQWPNCGFRLNWHHKCRFLLQNFGNVKVLLINLRQISAGGRSP
jgi:hypothetical protein